MKFLKASLKAFWHGFMLLFVLLIFVVLASPIAGLVYLVHVIYTKYGPIWTVVAMFVAAGLGIGYCTMARYWITGRQESDDWPGPGYH